MRAGGVMDWFDTVLQSLRALSRDNAYQKIAVSILIVFALWLARTVAVRFVAHRSADIRNRYMWQKSIKYVAFILGIIFIALIWFEAMDGFGTFLGLVAGGIAIALRDILTNIAGWLYLIWVRPLRVGDRIQIDEHAGDVIDISFFNTTLLEIGNWVDSDQSTGRIIRVPNGFFFTHFMANYGKGFKYIWNEIPVTLTFESNWRKAKDILLDIAKKHAENLSEEAEKQVIEASMRFMIFYSKLTPTVYTSVRGSGVLLTVRYLCEPRRRRNSEERIWEDILEAFAACDDIDFAYPTQRFYDNTLEGKPGARAARDGGGQPGA